MMRIVIHACFLLLLSGCSLAYFSPVVDRSFDGLESLLTEAEGADEDLSILIVHGIGPHRVGYADTLIQGLSQEMGLTTEEGEASCLIPGGTALPGGEWDFEGLGPEPWQTASGTCRAIPDESTQTSSWLRLVTRFHGQTRVRFYELTWHPIARERRKSFLHHERSQEVTRYRALVNNGIKQSIVNDRFSDAVLYLGAFGKNIRAAVESTLCSVMYDPDLENRGGCNVFEARSAAASNARVAMISMSLGSRVVFDTIRDLRSRNRDFDKEARDEARNEEAEAGAEAERGLAIVERWFREEQQRLREVLMGVEEASEEGREVIQERERRRRGVYRKRDAKLQDIRTREAARLSSIRLHGDALDTSLVCRMNRIYMLANQVPLLELSEKEHKESGSGVSSFFDFRASCGNTAGKLHMVAFSDPNDFLSYPISQAYARENQFRVSNVITVVGGLGLPGVMTDFTTAHSGHVRSPGVIRWLAKGHPCNTICPLYETD